MLMFRSGYKTEFPQKHISDESVAAAFRSDHHQKLERGNIVNASKHRMSSPYTVGDLVYMRNLRTSKFEPLFGPEIYTIIDISNGGAVIQSCNNSTTYRRHLDDLKLAPQTQDMNITWFLPDQAVPTPPSQNATANPGVNNDQPSRPRRNTRPPPYLNDYVRFVAEV